MTGVRPDDQPDRRATPVRVGVIGAQGRMGAAVCAAVDAAPDMDLVGAVGGREWLFSLADAGSEVVIDFTHPDAVKLYGGANEQSGNRIRIENSVVRSLLKCASGIQPIGEGEARYKDGNGEEANEDITSPVFHDFPRPHCIALVLRTRGSFLPLK